MQFEKILRQEYKLFTTIRRTMGQDIAGEWYFVNKQIGACGQLVVNSKSCNDKEVKDIEDLVSSKGKKTNTFTYETWNHTKSVSKRSSTRKTDEKYPRAFVGASVVMLTVFGLTTLLRLRK